MNNEPRIKDQNRIIRKMENRLAQHLAIVGTEQPTPQQEATLKSDIEWFITWAIKKSEFPESMWCDGVTELKISSENKRTYSIVAALVVGPESNVSLLYPCELSGSVTLSSHQKRLVSYQLQLNYQGNGYCVSKKI
jgi:hypothetical protein